LIVAAGPTASGKSALALSLAQGLDGEIVNGDSLQCYIGLDIGSAKPTAAERALLPHHLFDIVPPDETLTAGEYARRARPVLREIAGRGKVPVVVGGAGFYLQALLEGLVDAPGRDEAFRARAARAEARRVGVLHRYLRRLDGRAAAKIAARDVKKVTRALEIQRHARQSLSEVYEKPRVALEGFRVLKFALDPPRAELYARINARAEAMFAGGFLEEARELLRRYPPDAKAFESHGYREAVAVVRGEMELAAAIESTQIRTRHYAKRQWTWFRRDASIVWLPGFGTERTVFEIAMQNARRFLAAE
jgi:tRNA dimethylallyltransferase